MLMLRLTIGQQSFDAKLETELAPETCEAILRLLPLASRIIHARWSGEALWVPFGEQRLELDYENHTSYPSRGELLLYPGGLSEMEILVPYGSARFASKVGQLAGNHFATIAANLGGLAAAGREALWQGAQPFVLERI